MEVAPERQAVALAGAVVMHQTVPARVVLEAEALLHGAMILTTLPEQRVAVGAAAVLGTIPAIITATAVTVVMDW